MKDCFRHRENVSWRGRFFMKALCASQYEQEFTKLVLGQGVWSMSGSCAWRYEQKGPATLVLRQGWLLMRGSVPDGMNSGRWWGVRVPDGMNSGRWWGIHVPDGMNSGRWWGIHVPDGMNSGRWWGVRVPDGMNSGRWWGVRVPDGMNSGRWWGVRVPDGMNSGRWWGVRVPDGMNRGVCITVIWKWVISQEHGLSSQMFIVMALTERCWSCFLFLPGVCFLWDGGSSVVRAPDSWSKGRGFEPRQERRENFLHQGPLSVMTLRYPFHPRVTAVARKRSRSFRQKCRWQVPAKHTYTYLCVFEWSDIVNRCMVVWSNGVHRTRAVQQPKTERCQYTTNVDM